MKAALACPLLRRGGGRGSASKFPQQRFVHLQNGDKYTVLIMMLVIPSNSPSNSILIKYISGILLNFLHKYAKIRKNAKITKGVLDYFTDISHPYYFILYINL
jgi:hypothetical protein